MVRDPTSGRRGRLRLLGEGGAGKVWLVEDPERPGRRLALKELAGPSAAREESLRREFATLAALRHPNLAEVYQLEISPRSGLAEFTLEYVDGPGLVAAVAAEGPALLLDLAAEALRALAFLHDFGLVHRDLKPANLLVRREPRAGCRLVVLDFGLALRGGATQQEKTGPGGTLPYMAPELFSGEPADRKTDLYALGAVLWEAVHGRPPVELDARDVAGFIERAREGKRSRPPLPNGYPAGLAGWLEALLAPDPADRPSGAQEALARLNAACGCKYEIETRATRAARLASGRPPGRETELVRLWDSLVDPSGPRLVWLGGDAGSGKSRLLRWLVAEGAGAGWEVVSGLPALTRRAMPGDEPLTAGRLIEELELMAATKPALLLLDEAETAPPLAVELLDRVARGGARASFRIVTALRPSEVHDPHLRRLLADEDLLAATARIDLLPFDRDEVAEVARRATGTTSLAPQRVRWLHEASEGNPLLLETLLVEEGWEKGGKAATHRTLEASVASRITALSRPARDWLEALVVLGRETLASVVSRLCGVAEEDGLCAAEEPLRAGLAREDDGHWSPASQVVADFVKSAFEPERLRLLHRRAAELIDAEDGREADPGRLARLWAAAGERDRAREWAEEAAKKAEEADRPSEAADWLRLAICQLERRDPARASLRRRQADLLISAARYREAYRALAICLRLARDDAERARILARQARALAVMSHFTKALERAREARDLAVSASLPRVAAETARTMGWAMSRLALSKEGLALMVEAAEEHKTLDDPQGQAECLLLAGLCASNLRSHDARGHLEHAFEVARESGNVGVEVGALISIALVESRAWRLPESFALLEQAHARIASRDDLRQQQVVVLNNLGQVMESSGRVDKALEVAREAATVAANVGNRSALLTSILNEGDALTLTGRPAEAAALLARALEEARSRELEHVGHVKLTLAEALMDMPEPDQARIGGLLREALDDERASAEQRLAALLLELERRARRLLRSVRADPLRATPNSLPAIRRPGAALETRADLALARHLLDDNKRRRRETGRETAAYAEEKEPPRSRRPRPGRCSPRRSAAPAEAGRGRALPAAGPPSARRGRGTDRGTSRCAATSSTARSSARCARRRGAGRPPAKERLLAIYEMIRASTRRPIPICCSNRMLDMALDVVRAERGMILLRDGGRGVPGARWPATSSRRRSGTRRSSAATSCSQAGRRQGGAGGGHRPGRAAARAQERQPVRHPLGALRAAALARQDHRRGLPRQPQRTARCSRRTTCASSRRSPTTPPWRWRTRRSAASSSCENQRLQRRRGDAGQLRQHHRPLAGRCRRSTT